MKKIKSILFIVFVFLLALFAAILFWLWQHDRQNNNPLPIASSQLQINQSTLYNAS